MNLYEVYDANQNIFDADYDVVEAASASEAIKKYVNKKYPGKITKRWGDNVSLMVNKFTIRNGIRYKSGRVVWFEILVWLAWVIRYRMTHSRMRRAARAKYGCELCSSGTRSFDAVLA